MTAVTSATEVSGSRMFIGGLMQVTYTVVAGGAGRTIDLSDDFENIYYCKAFATTPGTDGEVFVTVKDTYLASSLTLTQNLDCELIVTGTAIKSTGGST